MNGRISSYLRSNVLGLIAIFIALGGVSWAATTVKKNTVVSKSIKNGEVATEDLAQDAATGETVDEASLGEVPSAQQAATVAGNSIGTGEVSNDSLTGSDIDESSLGIVPNADQLDGISSAGFIQNGSAAQLSTATVSGDARVQGLIRQGSETGTTEPPTVLSTPTGVITRRINSTSQAGEPVIARTGDMRLVRTSSSGDLRLVWDTGPGQRSIACFGLTSSGAAANVYLSIPSTAGSGLVYSDAQSIVRANCHFGYSYGAGHTTSVDLLRYLNDTYWIGFLTSTYNQ